MGEFGMEPENLLWTQPKPCTGEQLVEAYRQSLVDLPAFALIASTHYSPDDASRNFEYPSMVRLESVQEQRRFNLLDAHGRIISVVEDCPVQWTIKQSKTSWRKKRKTLMQIHAKKYKSTVEVSGGESWQKYLRKQKLTFDPEISDSLQVNDLKGQRFFKGNFITNGLLEKEPTFIPVDLPLQILIACGFKAPNSEDEWKKISEMYKLACFTTAIMYKEAKPHDVFILLSGTPVRTLADLRQSVEESERQTKDKRDLFVTADGNMIDGSTLTDYDQDTVIDASAATGRQQQQQHQGQLRQQQQQQQTQKEQRQQQRERRQQQSVQQQTVNVAEYVRDEDNVSEKIRIKQQAASIVAAEQQQQQQQKQPKQPKQHQPSHALQNGDGGTSVVRETFSIPNQQINQSINQSYVMTTDDEQISSVSHQPPINRSEFRGHEAQSVSKSEVKDQENTYQNARPVEKSSQRVQQSSRYMESDDTDGGLNWASIGLETQPLPRGYDHGTYSAARAYVEDHVSSQPVTRNDQDNHMIESSNRDYQDNHMLQNPPRDFQDNHVIEATLRDYPDDPMMFEDRDVEYEAAVRQDRHRQKQNRDIQDDLERDLDRMHVDERYIASAHVTNGKTSEVDRRSRGYIRVDDDPEIWQNQRKNSRPQSVEVRPRVSVTNAGGERRQSSKRVYQDDAMESDGGIQGASNSTYLRWPASNNRNSRGSTAYYVEETQAYPAVQLRTIRSSSQQGGPTPPIVRHTLDYAPPSSRRTSSISGYSTVPHSYKYLSGPQASYYQQQKQLQRQQRQQLQQILEHDVNNNADVIIRHKAGPRIQYITTDMNGYSYQNPVRISNSPMSRRLDTGQAYVVQRSHSAVPSAVIRPGPYLRAAPMTHQVVSAQVPSNVHISNGRRSYGSISRAAGRKLYATPYDGEMETVYVTRDQRPSSIMGAPRVGSRIYVHN